MSIICPACGASNRASAKFCRQCASLMTPLSPETQVLERDTEMLPPPGQRQRRRGSGSTPWLVPIVVAALCLGLLVIWLGRLGATRAPAVPATPAAPPAITAQAPAAPRPAAPATANTPTL
ncbi:MAG: zinc ribbon domain-containing protein, partial [Comamonadaceae bacterium]|nr:zinc ribbon domain-containing protein [Comamonadaceae bacterium]